VNFLAKVRKLTRVVAHWNGMEFVFYMSQICIFSFKTKPKKAVNFRFYYISSMIFKEIKYCMSVVFKMF